MSTSDNSTEENAVGAETKSALREWFGGWAGGLLIFYTIVVVGHISYCLFHWGGDEYAATVSDWICQIGYFGPFLYSFRAWSHPALSTRIKRAWLLIGLAHLGLFIGQCLWTYFELGLGESPFPSWADAGFLSYFPLMLPGLLYSVEAMQSKDERLGFALDSAIVLVSGFVVIWHFLLQPMANATDGDTLKTVLSLAYPVGDIVLLLGISSLVLRRSALSGRGLMAFLLIGVVGNFVADLWFGYTNLQGTYKTGDFVDSLYTIALFPIVIAAHYQYILASRADITEVSSVSSKPRSIILFPYIAIGLAYSVLVWVGVNGHELFSGVTIIAAALLTALVLTRQYIFVRENRSANAAVTELQELIQGIYSAATDGIGVADFDGRLLEVNEAIVQLTGYSHTELIGGMTTYDLTAEEHVEATRAIAATVIATQEPAEYEKDLVRKDGSQFTAAITVFPIKSSDGRPTALAAIVRDITKRRLTEERLQESEERWHLALRVNDDGIWDWNIRNKSYYYSPRWRRMFGFDDDEIIDATPANIDQYFHPDDKPLAFETNNQLRQTPYFDIEFRHLCKDGSYKWIRCRGEAILHPETGKIERMIGLNTDIERRKRAELEREAIRRILQGVSETSNLDELLALIHCSIRSVINADNCFVALYDKPSRLFKMQFFVDQFDDPPPPADLAGTRTNYVFRSEEPLFLDKDRTEKLERQGAFRLVGTQPNFWLGAPLKTPNEVIGVLVVQSYDESVSYTQQDLGFLTSVSGQVALAIERKLAEEQLKIFNQKLQQSNRELQDFAYVASHDLQEPLRKVQTFADRLTTKYAESLEGNGLDYLERMRSAANRMQTLIQDLLSFSRVATKAQPFVPVDLEQITQEVLSDLEVKIEETAATIEIYSLPKIDADPLQIRQLIQNLVGNALKFRQPNVAPTVKISATNGRSNGHGPIYTFTVEDNGIGFDEKYLDKIFTVFQRLHGRAEYEGSGIGLAICRKIVERHHGTITAESKPGSGARFVFSLPSRQPNAEVH